MYSQVSNKSARVLTHFKFFAPPWLHFFHPDRLLVFDILPHPAHLFHTVYLFFSKSVFFQICFFPTISKKQSVIFQICFFPICFFPNLFFSNGIFWLPRPKLWQSWSESHIETHIGTHIGTHNRTHIVSHIKSYCVSHFPIVTVGCQDQSSDKVGLRVTLRLT